MAGLLVLVLAACAGLTLATGTPGQPTATPTLAPTPTPTASPEPTPPDDAIQKVLEAWIEGGNAQVKAARFTQRGLAKVLNIFSTLNYNDNSSSWVEGVILASEIVDDHIIVYMGLETRTRKPFFIAINAGQLNEATAKTRSAFKYDRDLSAEGGFAPRRGFTDHLTMRGLVEYLQANQGEVVIFILASDPDPVFQYGHPESTQDAIEEVAQAPVTMAFLKASQRFTAITDSSIPQEVQELFNKRVLPGAFSPSNVMMTFGFGYW